MLLVGDGSKPVRSAILAYASLLLESDGQPTTLQYLGRCYEQLREAISTVSAVDVVYTTYLMATLAVTIITGVC